MRENKLKAREGATLRIHKPATDSGWAGLCPLSVGLICKGGGGGWTRRGCGCGGPARDPGDGYLLRQWQDAGLAVSPRVELLLECAPRAERDDRQADHRDHQRDGGAQERRHLRGRAGVAAGGRAALRARRPGDQRGEGRGGGQRLRPQRRQQVRQRDVLPRGADVGALARALGRHATALVRHAVVAGVRRSGGSGAPRALPLPTPWLARGVATPRRAH